MTWENVWRSLNQILYLVFFFPLAFLIVAGLNLSRLNLYLLRKVLTMRNPFVFFLIMSFIWVSRGISKINLVFLSSIFGKEG